jgi:hypothetical protein
MLTLAQIKVFLAITGTADDSILNACIADAKGEADRATNRQLATGSVTEYIQSNGGKSLVLGEFPVTAITSLQYFDGTDWVDIVESPDTIADSLLTLPGGVVEFIKSFTFPSGRVKAVYTAGYSDLTVPADIHKAIKYNAAVIYYDSPAGQGWFMKQSANTGGHSSEGYTIGRDKMVEYYEKTYSAYRKVNI